MAGIGDEAGMGRGWQILIRDTHVREQVGATGAHGCVQDSGWVIMIAVDVLKRSSSSPLDAHNTCLQYDALGSISSGTMKGRTYMQLGISLQRPGGQLREILVGGLDRLCRL
nr:hypothetical protein CFP56_28712 [Quercus suber]